MYTDNKITIVIFQLNFDGYYINKKLYVYLNCLQIYAYINASNGKHKTFI